MRIKAMRFAIALASVAAIATVLVFMVKAIDVRGERGEEVSFLSSELEQERDVQSVLLRMRNLRERELTEALDEWALVDAEVDSLGAELNISFVAFDEFESERDDKSAELQSFESERDKLAAELAAKKAAEEAVKKVVSPPPPTSPLPWPTTCPSGKNITVTATGYSSTPDQTWGDPYSTYTGTRVHWGTVAVHPSVIPLGCRMTISSFPGTIFTAEDRGGGINGHRIDIWFPTRQEALNWGVRTVTITIQ